MGALPRDRLYRVSSAGRWIVETHSATVADIHATAVPDDPQPTIRLARPTDCAIVLGSSQSDEHLDRGRARRLGLEIVRRNSGGGAVLVDPQDLLWVDVVVPAGDTLWDDDVGRAFHWLGRVWCSTLSDLGHAGLVHEGRYVRTPLSDVVCFAGLGPGEVSVFGAKAVGLSQRRTRHAARFQCAVVLSWRPQRLIEAFSTVPIEGFAGLVESAGFGVGPFHAEAEAAFLARMSMV